MNVLHHALTSDWFAAAVSALILLILPLTFHWVAPLLGLSAKFKQTPRKFTSTGNTANSNRDGTGTLVTLATGAAGQTEMNPAISIVAKGTTTEGMIRFYSDDATNKRLIGEVYVPAWTPSASKPTLQLSFTIPEADRLLPTTNDTIKWSTEKGESFDVLGSAWDYA